MNVKSMAVCGAFLLLASGCALQEVRSKSKIGPEFRHSGATNTDSERWHVEQGIDFKWDNGVTTGLSYRRRDVNDGNGDNENRVLFEFSFPLWKAESQQAKLKRRVELLETRLTRLEGAAQTEADQS